MTESGCSSEVERHVEGVSVGGSIPSVPTIQVYSREEFERDRFGETGDRYRDKKPCRVPSCPALATRGDTCPVHQDGAAFVMKGSDGYKSCGVCHKKIKVRSVYVITKKNELAHKKCAEEQEK